MANQYLLINELAKLFDISTHTLRFYEQKGLISPISRTEKGYRLYDFDAVSRLEEILICRHLDMPLEDIINYLDNKTPENFTNHLSTLEYKINKKISELEAIKSHILTSRNLVNQYINYKDSFFIKNCPKRYLLFLKKLKDRESIQLYERDLYNIYLKASGNMPLKASKDLVFYSTDDRTDIYLLIHSIDLPNLNTDNLMILPEGNYLCRFHISKTIKDYIKLLENVDKYLKKNNLDSEDFFIDILSSDYGIFNTAVEFSCMQIFIPKQKTL